jgi:dehydrogenase/reductase SDR family protein 7
VLRVGTRSRVLTATEGNFAGKHCPNGVVVLPLDIASDVTELKEAVMKAETAFVGVGVDVMVHNAASQRPVSSASFLCTPGMYNNPQTDYY